MKVEMRGHEDRQIYRFGQSAPAYRRKAVESRTQHCSVRVVDACDRRGAWAIHRLHGLGRCENGRAAWSFTRKRSAGESRKAMVGERTVLRKDRDGLRRAGQREDRERDEGKEGARHPVAERLKARLWEACVQMRLNLRVDQLTAWRLGEKAQEKRRTLIGFASRRATCQTTTGAGIAYGGPYTDSAIRQAE